MANIQNLNMHYNNVTEIVTFQKYKKGKTPLNQFFLILYLLFVDNETLDKFNETSKLQDFFIQHNLIQSALHYKVAFELWKSMYPFLVSDLLKNKTDALITYIDTANEIFYQYENEIINCNNKKSI